MRQISCFELSGAYSNNRFELTKGTNIININLTNIRGTEGYLDDCALVDIKEHILKENVDVHGIHFIDNGNYHYMSKLFIDEVDYPFVLLVFDNHPDMQTPAFGDILSCGSWVKDSCLANNNIHAALLYGVKRELLDEIEVPANVGFVWDKEEMLRRLRALGLPVYISIDKDVLDKGEYLTNWDQGCLSADELCDILAAVTGEFEVVAVDICGGVTAVEELGVPQSVIDKNIKLNSRIINNALIKFMVS